MADVLTGARAMPSQQRVADAFLEHFGERPLGIVRAPGRVNLIGEHTDYNDGFVLPMAIDSWVSIAVRPRGDGVVSLRALDLNSEDSFPLARPGARGGDWIDYARGVAWAFGEAGTQLSGFDGVISGDIPKGAGLSSSAALEMAVARAFFLVSDLAWDPIAAARAGQRAESEWVGVSCGIMDQLISACGQRAHALLIDCRSLELRPVRLPEDAAVVVLDTSTRRELVTSGYNERRNQCSTAAKACGARSLRDVTSAELAAAESRMEAAAFRRARHVLTENGRTLEAEDAMQRGDAATLGRLMNESHRSLRDDFEVSTAVMDAMVDAARGSSGCFGARLTGAGFGGCVVALVERDRLDVFAIQVQARFKSVTGLTPVIYPCEAVDGAHVLGGSVATNIA